MSPGLEHERLLLTYSLTQRNFINAFKRRADVLLLLMFLRDYYQLNLTEKKDRDFLISLYYLNTNKESFKKYSNKFNLLAENPIEEIEVEILSGQKIFLAPISNHLDKKKLNNYKKCQENATQLLERLEKEILEETSFDLMQKSYDQCIEEVLNDCALNKSLPRSSGNFYEEFEGVAH
jgi:hypothetical protein